MVSAIGGFNLATYAATTALARNKTATATDDTGLAAPTPTTAKDDFLAYMKKTPAQRMEENWLRAHGLSEEKLAAMSPEDRAKVMKEMKDDIEQKLKTQTEQKAQHVDISA
ncbi:MAG: hypothetical protein P4L57_09625 [Rhizomicrobium sp.]|nr:hypothetical protein [Rhizomicrobium sp.]